MSEARVFLDSNVLVYAHDVSAGAKNETAREIIGDLWKRKNGALSTQVVQEFFVTVTRKLPQSMDTVIAQRVVSDLLKWHMVVNDGQTILDAIELMKRYKFSFWDCLIVQAALHSGAELLLSEDLSSGQKIGGMTIENPFE